MSQSIYIAANLYKEESLPIEGDYKNIEGEDYFKIANFDKMRPFFMTLVSNSDHWLFISSTGGLTAGRKNEHSSLFPYYTDEKISDSFETTGPKTIIRVDRRSKKSLWEPFSDRYQGSYTIRRNLYKNVYGNKIIFEEINEDLQLQFRYSWKFSDNYGFVRKAALANLGDDKVKLNILDGIQNILPYGVNSGLQNERSNLVNAYKKNELEIEEGLGLFLLSAIIVDKAEPSEALKATTVWSSGIEADHYLLSSRQLSRFRMDGNIDTETNVKAEPGAYFINSSFELDISDSLSWKIIAELNQDHTSVNNLLYRLKNNKNQVLADLEKDIDSGTENLKQLVGMADGLQLTNDHLMCARHFTNVLFNIMRGGIFDDGYLINSRDFKDYSNTVKKTIVNSHKSFYDGLPDTMRYPDLLERAMDSGNADLIRISYEYLPLTFSRRHGDPSRPWNRFSIETRKEDGSKNLDYQGNWRDIFQNWEALALSYPLYINSMVSKFVNASTIDGYNPYRIMRSGIDWEVIEPDDPWSFIGYWGDHQIIYLLKLLEISNEHTREELTTLLNQLVFVYANVPYEIKSYDDILNDPKDTIDFDHQKEKLVGERVQKFGSDGKMVMDANENLITATLTEKLILTLLTKLSNFIPEGGIWLNTQRPEWNDANNALVGNGVSMVTLYYIRRYLTFCSDLFSNDQNESYLFNQPVSDFLQDISGCLNEHLSLLSGSISNENRRIIMDKLGRAGDKYRNSAYRAFEGTSKGKVNKSELLKLFDVSLQHIDHSILRNKRADGLYHSYNLVEIKEKEASIEYLYEMLEGQVSVLSSGFLNPKEAIEVLKALKMSKIYREDQYSYLLYPNRELPRFLSKNNIPQSFISSSELAQTLIKNGDVSLLTQDVNGNCHFNGSFTNANGLMGGLEILKSKGYAGLVEREYDQYLEVFETMFNHRSFTGRSGTFFGYEGLGSIYWHMVSKLLLAIQENISWAGKRSDSESVKTLIDYYYQVREGIGVHKSPSLYGAFSTDAYSHTPATKGAQQPGMTGQVKEDVMNRWAELGIVVKEGAIQFNPILLKSDEYLSESKQFEYYDLHNNRQTLELGKGELAFTYCQVPIIYKRGDNQRIILEMSDDTKVEIEGSKLTLEASSRIFNRSGEITMIKVVCNI